MIRKKPLMLIFPCFLFVFLGMVFLGAARESWMQFPLDDAWIHQVYARSLAMGEGLSYNPGVQEAGFTSPLWVLVTSPVHIFHYFQVEFSAVLIKCMGLVLGLLVLIRCWQLCFFWSRSFVLAVCASGIMAIEPKLYFAVFSGMEDTLFLVLWLSSIYSCLKKRPWIALLYAALLPVTRPEGLLLLPALGIHIFFLFRLENKSVLKGMKNLALLALPMAAWMFFCLHVNGHLLPNTYYVKSGFEIPHAGALIRTFFDTLRVSGFSGQIIFFGMGILSFAVYLIRQQQEDWKWSLLHCLAMPMVYTLAILFSRDISPNGYYWLRYFSSAYLMWTLVFSLGLILWFQEWGVFFRTRDRRQRKRGLYLVAVMNGLLLCNITVHAGTSFINRRRVFSLDCKAIYELHVRSAFWIGKNTSEKAVIGGSDAGALRYWGDRHVIDLAGLNHNMLLFDPPQATKWIDAIDFLVMPPGYLGERPSEMTYTRVAVFQVPPEKFTIAPRTNQNRQEIYARKLPSIKKTPVA